MLLLVSPIIVYDFTCWSVNALREEFEVML